MFRAFQVTRLAVSKTMQNRQTVARTAANVHSTLDMPANMSTSSGCPFLSGDYAAVMAKSSQCPHEAKHQTPTTGSAPATCQRAFSASSQPAAPQGLTTEQTAIIKATVPILEAGGVDLTKHFYSILMKNDTVRPLFNQTHQASGAQPRALAFSVLNYAKNIDKLENLGPLATQIVNKHCSFHVMPEHYPIVGDTLLRAIREVLGPQVATDAVIEAWGKAYQQLADILIAAEAKVYDALAAAPGGWRGSRDFVVKAKTPASADGSVVSFDLVPKDGKQVIQYSPGQYIGILAHLGNNTEARRNYSLSQAADSKSLRISVKRIEGGAVSTYLHDSVKVGDTIEVLSPAGEFVLNHTEEPLVLISAGVGITPTIAMLQAATSTSAPSRKIAFLHYTQNSNTHAFAQDLESTASGAGVSVYTAYTDCKEASSPSSALRGRVNTDHLKQVLSPLGPAETVNAYVLGPEGFMKTVKQELISLGVPVEKVKYEFFGPASQI